MNTRQIIFNPFAYTNATTSSCVAKDGQSLSLVADFDTWNQGYGEDSVGRNGGVSNETRETIFDLASPLDMLSKSQPTDGDKFGIWTNEFPTKILPDVFRFAIKHDVTEIEDQPRKETVSTSDSENIFDIISGEKKAPSADRLIIQFDNLYAQFPSCLDDEANFILLRNQDGEVIVCRADQNKKAIPLHVLGTFSVESYLGDDGKMYRSIEMSDEIGDYPKLAKFLDWARLQGVSIERRLTAKMPVQFSLSKYRNFYEDIHMKLQDVTFRNTKKFVLQLTYNNSGEPILLADISGSTFADIHVWLDETGDIDRLDYRGNHSQARHAIEFMRWFYDQKKLN